MIPAPLLLTFDVGTQSLRAALISAQGTLQAIVQRPLEAADSPNPGWAEKDPEYFYTQMGGACRELLGASPDCRGRIAGVAVTGQRASLVVVDGDGRPLRPAILWADQRSTHNIRPLGGLFGLGIAAVGAADTVAHSRAQAEVNWIATHEPAIWAKTARVLVLCGWLNFKLCGEFVDSVANQVAYLPFDFRRHRWHRPGDWRWPALGGLRPGQMADLVAPGTVLGGLTGRAADDLCLPAGLPIVAAAADKACEVLGTGCLAKSQACLSFGTAATVNVPNRRYVQIRRFAPAYPAATPGGFTTEVQVYRGFWLVSWFMREFGQHERSRAESSGVPAETLLDELLQASRPGANGLMAQPYWSPGIKEPGPEARGAIIGFTDGHTRAHVYRALVEGLGFALREGLERIESRGRLRVSSLRVAGGGANSDAIMQITADLFGLPAARPQVTEASSLGAAICAAVAVGHFDDFPTAVSAMCRPGREFEPDLNASRLYDNLYRKVYVPMYRRLRPLYAAARKITGLPE